MTRQRWFFLGVLGLLVCLVWGWLIAFWLSVSVSSSSSAIAASTIVSEETVTPTLTRAASPTRAPASTPTPITTPVPTLPVLYIDGPYIRRSDTRAPVWFKGVNIEEFRQPTPHTFADLYNVQGLKLVVEQKWGVNLLRVAIDPELVGATWNEIAKLIAFAQANGMYVILVPFASAVNSSRNDERLPVPDALVATAMGSLASKFKDRTNVLYGLWNEPHPDSIPSAGYDQQWQIWMDAGIQVAQSIRSKNPKAILVVPGGTKWARDLTYYQDHPFPFDNVIYDVHDYWAYPAYHYHRTMWTWAIGKYPIMIGEFGGDPTNPSAANMVGSYMQQTFRIIDQNPAWVHYTIYAMTNDGVWGIFTHGLATMPKGNALRSDLSAYPPTRFR
jgi:Cellulase (glycosyl hydrolase family 5)